MVITQPHGALFELACKVTSLKKEMNNKGISEFDNGIAGALKEIPETTKTSTSGKTTNTKVESKKLSEAEKLLASGKFPEAKRAFASEGNSTMAQVCSELIKSKRTINLYQSGINTKPLNNFKTVLLWQDFRLKKASDSR